MSDAVPVHHECATSVALDGARIACHTTLMLLEVDQAVPEALADAIAERVQMARALLDQARGLLVVETTSLHMAAGVTPGGLIIPSR
ncbi:MAG: hypothetical protein P4L99_27930 [Chthoniobacter sp.]|nr:hypothetical protein [Chthoniobacter sp.]